MSAVRPRRQIGFALILALVTLLGVGSPASATYPGRNGQIVFMRNDANDHWQIWIADADLTNARQVAHFDGNAGWPVWSPDGSRIAFDGDLADPDPTSDPYINDIYTIKPDGTGLRKLTDSVGYAGAASTWSPDGRLIAFEADRGDYPAQAGIYVMNARDGSNRHRITSLSPGVDWDGAPRFSPDGKHLAFTRFTSEGSAVHTIRLDGTGLQRLTPWDVNAGDADWSPDGMQLVFEANPTGFPRGSAWVVGADGRHLKNLTPEPTIEGVGDGYADPVFSPDGRTILVLHGLFFPDGRFTAGLASMRADGRRLRYVADGLGEEHQVDWARRVKSDR